MRVGEDSQSSRDGQGIGAARRRFVISEEGIVVAACPYFDALLRRRSSAGLGSRHLAAASVSQKLRVIAIVVSESGVVRVFHDGD